MAEPKPPPVPTVDHTVPLSTPTRILLLHTAERAQDIWSVSIYDWVGVWNVFMCLVWVSVLLARPGYLMSSPYLRPLNDTLGWSGTFIAFAVVGTWQAVSLFAGTKVKTRQQFWSLPILLRHVGFLMTLILWLTLTAVQFPAGWTVGFGYMAGQVVLQYVAVGQMYSNIGVETLKREMRAEDAKLGIPGEPNGE